MPLKSTFCNRIFSAVLLGQNLGTDLHKFWESWKGLHVTRSLSVLLTLPFTWASLEQLGTKNTPIVMVADGVSGHYLRNAETNNLE